MRRVAVIADDLTGALDTVSPFAERGLKAAVFTSVEDLDIKQVDEAEVIGVSTNSRHLEPSAAAELAAEAARRLRSWRPEVILKKIDSRLKGNVAAESSAVARVLGYAELTIAPAAPDVGRYTANGSVAGTGIDAPIQIDRAFASCGLVLSVRDAATQEKLDEIAASALSFRRGLIVCSRGLAVSLARLLAPPTQARPLDFEEPILLAIGSRDPATLRQIDLLCEAGEFDRVIAEQGCVPDRPRISKRSIMQCEGAETLPGETVAARFAEGIARHLSKAGIRTLLLSGGDTASAVFRALGIKRVTVCGEAAPGLPWSVIPMAGGAMTVISKSGSFGGPETLLRLFPPSAATGTRQVVSHGSH